MEEKLFPTKKVLIFGLGLQGGGLSATRFFAKHSYRVRVTDLKTEKELKPTLKQLEELDLAQFNTIVVNSSDKQLVSDSIDNLVVEENVNSWQQNWLTHWNDIQRILESSAKKPSSWFKKTSNKKPAKKQELEL